LIIVGCIVFGLSLLAHLPAKLVFPKNSGEFQFIGVGGSVWRGEVKQILFSGKALPIRSLNWSVNPIALITGTLKADFHEQQTPINRGSMNLNLLSRQLELHAIHWQLPAYSLDAWIPLPRVRCTGSFCTRSTNSAASGQAIISQPTERATRLAKRRSSDLLENLAHRLAGYAIF